MESGEDVPSRSNCSSPADPLALLSDCAVGSSYSSWSSEESLSCSSLPPAGKENISFNWTPTSCYNINEINWQRRCTRLQDELCRVRKQTNRVKEILRRKVTNSFPFLCCCKILYSFCVFLKIGNVFICFAITALRIGIPCDPSGGQSRGCRK